MTAGTLDDRAARGERHRPSPYTARRDRDIRSEDGALAERACGRCRSDGAPGRLRGARSRCRGRGAARAQWQACTGERDGQGPRAHEGAHDRKRARGGRVRRGLARSHWRLAGAISPSCETDRPPARRCRSRRDGSRRDAAHRVGRCSAETHERVARFRDRRGALRHVPALFEISASGEVPRRRS